MTTRLATVTARTAAEICRCFELSDGAKGLLTDTVSPGEYLDQLVGAGHFVDAVRLLAHALGRREGVWWACLCSRAALQDGGPPAAAQALRAAEAWVYQPSEENRRAADAGAAAEGRQHPASWAAMAAFWSGGSIAPPANPQPVPPDPFFTARAVAGAVVLAAIRHEPQHAPERYRRFLAQAVEIANAPAAGAAAPRGR